MCFTCSFVGLLITSFWPVDRLPHSGETCLTEKNIRVKTVTKIGKLKKK